MKLASMKMLPGESEYSMMSQPMNPEYPYGLRLCLKETSIAKLGIKDMPEIGSEMMITCKVKVVEVSQEIEPASGAEKDAIERELELQIVEMGIEPAKTAAAAAAKLYK